MIEVSCCSTPSSAREVRDTWDPRILYTSQSLEPETPIADFSHTTLSDIALTILEQIPENHASS